MLTVVEKVMVLQGVDVFSEVSTEPLSHLAAIAREEARSAGEVVFRESDPSDAMYLVLTGRVRLHRGGMEVLVVGPNEAFGTWSLFDDEPRVVTAEVVDDAQLLRIDKEDFIDLLADHVQITQGVLKALVKRLRALLGRIGPSA